VKRIPTLDGWRGIAIALVLLDHLQFPLFGKSIAWWPQTGLHGVTIFFVLSGFLITSILLENWGDLRRFYIRRFFRLMPAAWTYLAAMVLWDCISGMHIISVSAILACVFFYRNFAVIPMPMTLGTGHFWSLSVEEQFYMVWPLLLLAVGARRARWIAPALALAFALWRSAHWLPWTHTLTRADALLIGYTLALLVREERMARTIRRFAPWCAVPALVTFVYCMVRFQYLQPIAESASIAVLIAASTNYPQSAWFRWLDWKPLAGLGRASYSLYIWQQFFVLFHGFLTPFYLCCIPLFAAGSYLYIERPCIRLGHRLTTPDSAQSAKSRGDQAVPVSIDEQYGGEAS
jgi:peptidoglycan/LPS O-acetylase OafA/YrhL